MIISSLVDLAVFACRPLLITCFVIGQLLLLDIVASKEHQLVRTWLVDAFFWYGILGFICLAVSMSAGI